MSSLVDIIDAHCNSCSGGRRHKILHQMSRTWEFEDDYGYEHSGRTDFYFLECMGCEEVKYLQRILRDDWIDPDDGTVIPDDTYYPPSESRKSPEWLYGLRAPTHISALMHEIYRALQNDAPALATMGVRALIEFVMIDKVNDQGSFKKNLAAFRDAGFISPHQERLLTASLELGHASAHRGFTPARDQLAFCLDTIEGLIHGLYVLETQVHDSSRNIPKR